VKRIIQLKKGIAKMKEAINENEMQETISAFAASVADSIKKEMISNYGKMTDEEKKEYRKMLDEKLPPDEELLKKYFPEGLPSNPYPY
jgi:predicted ATP-binding protein involved in virulence